MLLLKKTNQSKVKKEKVRAEVRILEFSYLVDTNKNKTDAEVPDVLFTYKKLKEDKSKEKKLQDGVPEVSSVVYKK